MDFLLLYTEYIDTVFTLNLDLTVVLTLIHTHTYIYIYVLYCCVFTSILWINLLCIIRGCACVCMPVSGVWLWVRLWLTLVWWAVSAHVGSTQATFGSMFPDDTALNQFRFSLHTFFACVEKSMTSLNSPRLSQRHLCQLSFLPLA